MVGLVAVVLALAAPPAEWKRFTPPGGGGSVLLPADPKDDSDPEQPGKPVVLKEYVLEVRPNVGYRFNVNRVKPNGPPFGADTRTALVAGLKARMREVGAEVVDEAPLELKGTWAAELTVKTNVEKQPYVRNRIYVTEGAIYHLMAYGPKEAVTSAEAGRYLGSLVFRGAK